MDANQNDKVNHRGTVLRLVGIAIGMFAFGFALVPLYNVFCEITGINGKTGAQYVATGNEVADEAREIKVQFVANNNGAMSWDFRPTVRTMQVHPGRIYHTEFYARNPTAAAMTGQAVPSISPFHAAEYFHKTECFCFEQQHLAEGQAVDMPLAFIIDAKIPADVTTLTLSYTMFDVTGDVGGELADRRPVSSSGGDE